MAGHRRNVSLSLCLFLALVATLTLGASTAAASPVDVSAALAGLTLDAAREARPDGGELGAAPEPGTPREEPLIPPFPAFPPRPVASKAQLPWRAVITGGQRLAPLARGPAAHRRAFAELLYAEASAYFIAERYRQALAAYVLAARFWAHPTLQLGVAETLINLGRSAEAYQHLAGALGDRYLSRRQRRRALRYLETLRRSRGLVDLSCHVSRARVYLNGRATLSGPARVRLVLQAGLHNLLIERPGHRPQGLQIYLEPGAKLRVALR